MIISWICKQKPVKARNCFYFFSTTSLPDIDLNYYCDVKNISEIKQNITTRKGIGDIDKVHVLFDLFKNTPTTNYNFISIKKQLYEEVANLPNKTHPIVKTYEEPHVVKEINKIKDFGSHKPLELHEIAQLLNLIRTDKLGYTCGNKSYYYLGELAELEEALIKYTVSSLLRQSFELVSVPDILSGNTLHSCGMSINNDRTQIYSLDSAHGPDLYLSGTAEMSLAGLLKNSIHSKDSLPLKLAAVSRCYRAETSNLLEERGTYRVHQFTKVEMFAVTTEAQSEKMLEDLREIQENLFRPLGFHMKVLDMPAHELGAPAHRKYDIEAWMAGRNKFGEISSCSNCTDYQSRRLNIKCSDGTTDSYVHTLNGTACAIPRMLIALLEAHQDPKGKINIPVALQPFINGKQFIGKNSNVPKLKLLKLKK